MSSHDETARLVEMLQRGAEKARADLLAHTRRRLEQLARQMLRCFAVVRRFEQTDDILQNALLRLLKALDEMQLQSDRHFYRLAALQIRRELVDLARHYSGPAGLASNHETDDHDPEHGVLARQPALSGQPSSLAEWNELHEAIANLPDEEQEIIDLLFYQGLTQPEAAQLLDVDERTVRRRLHVARYRLDKALAR
jgi:RNA polymerase sigma-70 factor (ECF subfamily)